MTTWGDASPDDRSHHPGPPGLRASGFPAPSPPTLLSSSHSSSPSCSRPPAPSDPKECNPWEPRAGFVCDTPVPSSGHSLGHQCPSVQLPAQSCAPVGHAQCWRWEGGGATQDGFSGSKAVSPPLVTSPHGHPESPPASHNPEGPAGLAAHLPQGGGDCALGPCSLGGRKGSCGLQARSCMHVYPPTEQS